MRGIFLLRAVAAAALAPLLLSPFLTLAWIGPARAAVTALEHLSAADLFLFPERRREWLLAAKIGATLRQFAVEGFAPLVRVGFERNISTVGIYDYRRIAAEFGIVRAF